MGEVVQIADYVPKQKDKPKKEADVVRLNRPPRFRLVDGVLVQFPIQTCQQEPD
jgi:hypothetical protein